MSEYARSVVGADSLGANGKTWTGAGETIGVIDSGVDAEHPDLTGRVVPLSWGLAPADDLVGHGTHVCGIAAGSGAASGGKVRGMAPDAELVTLGIVVEGRPDLPEDLGELLDLVVARGAKIVNLSWGHKMSSVYENGAMAVDTFIRKNPEILVVVAAGNEGEAPTGYPFLYTVGSPATSKNALTVGASCSSRPDFPGEVWKAHPSGRFPLAPTAELPVAGDPDLPAPISSRGPSGSDGVGPDLLAPGTAVLAPRAKQAPDRAFWRPCAEYGGRYGFMTGTSMAAPVVSGAAAVVREYLRTECGLASPSAALVKAHLVAAADRLPWSRAAEDEVDFGYPDFDQGYGRLNLASTLPGKGTPSGRRLACVDVSNDSDDALESRPKKGSSRKPMRTYRLRVKEGATEPLRFVLCWDDYSVAGVQNELNLSVRPPAARWLRGNGGHSWLVPKVKYLNPVLQGLVLDHRNNVQRIDVESPKPGAYELKVLAVNTLFPPQGYAICACGELDSDLEPVR